MNKNDAIVKINKYGKAGTIITRILLVLIGIGTVTTLIAGIALMAIPKEAMQFSVDGTVNVTFDPEALGAPLPEDEIDRLKDFANNPSLHAGINMGTISYELDNIEMIDGKIVASSNGSTTNISLSRFSAGCFIATIALVLTFISMLFGSKLCKAFEKCESPFEDNVIKKMKHFAISLLPWALFSSIPESYFNSLLNNNLRMTFDLNMPVVFTVLIILALTVVFKYGGELQKESDETL